MKIKATRDSAEYSLTRTGIFQVGSTSGTIPLRIRRLTGGQHCEAKFLTEDDRLHINELYRPIGRREIRTLSKGSEDKITTLTDVFQDRLAGVKNDVNMIRLAVPSRIKYTEALATSILNLLYIKNNKLILFPLNSNKRTLSSRQFLLDAVKDMGEVAPKRELVGYLSAHSPPPLVETMMNEYIKLGVKVFAVDVGGGTLPPGLLGGINAFLDREMDGDFLVIVINQPQTPRGNREDLNSQGQTVRANDVADLPRGYDGYAPNRIGFGSDDDSSKKKESPRFKRIRIKDEKGKKRMFVPESWGRAQISAILDEEPDLVSRHVGSVYCTKTSRSFGFDELFEDDDVLPSTFEDVLRCHDTELVERELDKLGQSALEGIVQDRIETKTYGRPMMPRIELERKEYDKAVKKKGKQHTLF